jgi:predicted dehydrogenase
MAKTPTPKVGIALVGLGFMGLTHLRAAKALRKGRVVAVVTADPKKARGDFSNVSGNFGSSGTTEDLSGITVYPTLDAALADDRVRLVDICLPSYLHASAALRCLEKGKAVIVEKPIALRAADARRMLAASAAHGAPLLVAQVLKFMPEFSALIDTIASSRYGALLALHLRRWIAKPSWGDDSWFKDPEKSGGMTLDLHVHDTNLVVDVFGKPESVQSQGLAVGAEVQSIHTTYRFPGNDSPGGAPFVTASAGWINASSLPFLHGYDAFFEKATIQFDSTHCPVPRVWSAKGAQPLRLPKGDGFSRELQAAVDSVLSGEPHPFLSPENALASLLVCEAETRSVLKGGKTVAC